MNAVLFKVYGAPDVLQVQPVARPTPAAGEVLVKVHAAALNPLDRHIMRGEPFLARLEYGLRRPHMNRLGADFAGHIEAIGEGVTRVAVGDAVFGEKFKTGLGTLAEYITVHDDAVCPKPDNISYEAAAGVPMAGLTALQGLRGVSAGQRVLVNGASGGVGTFAVQIAKALGAHVTGVCSTRNVDLVRELGADDVIDYTANDFAATGQTYHRIVDTVGNRTLSDLRRALTPDGSAEIIGFVAFGSMLRHALLGAVTSALGSRKAGMMGTVKPNAEDLATLRGYLASGQVTPVIDTVYPLADVAEAMRHLETGRARGKIIVTMP